MIVCGVCGVSVTTSRTGRLVHIEAPPKGVESHDVSSPRKAEEFRAEEEARVDVHGLATELIDHHTITHPFSECEWSQRLAAALRSNG